MWGSPEPRRGDHGQCGACTVLIDGRRVLSCLTLAAAAQGKAITTIEGLSQKGEMPPMQQAFIDNDAFQCGYCTPGQILSAVACVHEGHAGTDADIREYMSGNLCRCAAYPNIGAAIKQAKTVMQTALKDQRKVSPCDHLCTRAQPRLRLRCNPWRGGRGRPVCKAKRSFSPAAPPWSTW
jgi:aerobic-type carbon monoxide dehydrogenase small subunit (CoxS/CutS family)